MGRTNVPFDKKNSAVQGEKVSFFYRNIRKEQLNFCRRILRPLV